MSMEIPNTAEQKKLMKELRETTTYWPKPPKSKARRGKGGTAKGTKLPRIAPEPDDPDDE